MRKVINLKMRIMVNVNIYPIEKIVKYFYFQWIVMALLTLYVYTSRYVSNALIIFEKLIITRFLLKS